MDSQTDVPKGKVSCLLCRGFISYKKSDRARVKDHMLNEHDVKYDSDVILSVSVMTQKEKAYIVKSALKRLNEIGNNQFPTSGEALISPVLAPNNLHPRIPNPPPRYGNPRGRPPGAQPQQSQTQKMQRPPTIIPSSISSGPHSGRPQVVPSYQHPPPPVQQLPHNFPQNQSISISVVDQSAKCSSCNIVLKNSSLLADHMKTEHLSRFSGLIIATPSEMSNKRTSLPAAGNSSNLLQSRPNPLAQQELSKRPRTIETPVNINRLSLLKTASTVTSVSSQSKRIPRNYPKLHPNNPNSKAYLSSKQAINPGRSPKHVSSPDMPESQVQSNSNPFPVDAAASQPPKPEPPKPDPVIKCNTCYLFIKQSVFKNHKTTHEQEEKVVTPDLREKELVNISKPKEVLKIKRREEKQIDFIDLGDSDDETAQTAAKKLKSTVEKNISCPSCNKKLATNMALKMHMNLKHPVKTEEIDTEKLLVEDTDDASKDKIRNEVENMETLELLDNLVNFLNET